MCEGYMRRRWSLFFWEFLRLRYEYDTREVLALRPPRLSLGSFFGTRASLPFDCRAGFGRSLLLERFETQGSNRSGFILSYCAAATAV